MACIIVILSLFFMVTFGTLYLAFVSLALTIYTIITMLNVENDSAKTTIHTNNNTIMTRSRSRLREN
jgi:hypothetical protein